jgi:hypothetical protein
MTAATLAPAATRAAGADRAGADRISLARVGLDEVRRFAYLQGLGKNLVVAAEPVDDHRPTTSALPPAAARGSRGVPLPAGTCEVLDVAFPGGRVPPAAHGAIHDDRPTTDAGVIGHLLLAALGLQRREIDQPYADHRAVASGRARFPVHAWVIGGGAVRYLDHYRHALVDVAVDGSPPHPGTAASRIVLAARYSDLPLGYQHTRASVAEAELGIALRAVTECARLFGGRVRTVVGGCELAEAAVLVQACGPGVWSAPVVVEVALPDRAGAVPRSVVLPGPVTPAGAFLDGDTLLGESLADPTARQAARISAARLDLAQPRCVPGAPGSGDIRGGIRTGSRPARGVAQPSWADVLGRRSAGNAPGGRQGFSLRPAPLPDAVLVELAGWAAMAAPLPDEITGEITVRVAVQRAADRVDGLYRLVGRDLVLERADARLVGVLADRYGQRSTADTEIGLRHACAVWQISARLDQILERVGPAGWPMVQLFCGWVLHGLSLAAAASGLINRPTRSYDEHTVAQTLGLDRRDIPMFMSVCGRPAYLPPALDLRP